MWQGKTELKKSILPYYSASYADATMQLHNHDLQCLKTTTERTRELQEDGKLSSNTRKRQKKKKKKKKKKVSRLFYQIPLEEEVTAVI